MYNRQKIYQENTLKECKIMRAIYVQAVVVTWTKGFLKYMFTTQQNNSIQSIIQVMKNFV